MEPFRIKIINSIAPEGLALFSERFILDPAAADPHAIIVRSSPLDTDDYPGLLAVARAGAGVNNISVDKATARGICVFNTPGANANAVAELVFTMLGIWVRNIHQGIQFCKERSGLSEEQFAREVEEQKSAFRGYELAGKTLGVLGLGKIGVQVANSGVQRQMRVIGFDPSPALENIHALSSAVTLSRSQDLVLREVDILSLHLPLNSKTRGLVSEAFLRRLRPGATLINFARGQIVDDHALLAALAAGHLRGYITDFPNSSIINHPLVLASPHLGASTEESEDNCSRLAVSQLRAYLEYGTIYRSVNFPTVESIPAGSCHTRFIMINRDIPGMIGFASQLIGSHGINIASYLNESNGIIGYNIIDLEAPVSAEIIAGIEANPGVLRTRTIRCAQSDHPPA